MWKIWAAVGSVVIGVLIASLLGGTPSWAVFVLVPALLVGVCAILFSGIREHWRTRSTSPPPPTPVDPDTHQRGDREIVLEVRRIVRDDDLYWLTSVDFVSPWHAGRVTPWANLISYRTQGHVFYHHALDGAFDDLVSAAASFLEAHRTNSFTDSLVVDNDWRNVSGSNGTPELVSDAERELLNDRRSALRARAASAADAYRRFSDLAGELTGA